MHEKRLVADAVKKKATEVAAEGAPNTSPR